MLCKNTQAEKNDSTTGGGGGGVASQQQKQALLENAAKNYPLINWIKQTYAGDKALLLIVKDYEDTLMSMGSLDAAIVAGLSALGNGKQQQQQQQQGTSAAAAAAAASVSASMPNLNETSASDSGALHTNGASASGGHNEAICLYLPDLYKSVEIKENLVNSVLTLVKSRPLKILDEEAYLMRKVNAGKASAQSASTSTSLANIYDHYRLYNEIILPNLSALSKNVKDSVVLFALDHADARMLDILREHACIPVSPFARKLKRPGKLIHPFAGKLHALYSDTDERFPCGSTDTYMREDRLHMLRMLGMRSEERPSWSELVERAESVTKLREYDVAVERAIAILAILNEMLSSSSSGTTSSSSLNVSSPTSVGDSSASSDNASDGGGGGGGGSKNASIVNALINQKLQSSTSAATASATQVASSSAEEEKEAKFRACEAIRQLAFIPVKPRPNHHHRLQLVWHGDKYKFRLAKPVELLAHSYEPLCSCTWALPLAEYRKSDVLFTRHMEQFLGLDDLAGKFGVRDALRQLDEACKIGQLRELDDSKEIKTVVDMCHRIYEYLQTECERKKTNNNNNNNNECVALVRAFFAAEKRCVLVGEEFVCVQQLCWSLGGASGASGASGSVSLRPMFYELPADYVRSFRHLFGEVLGVRAHLDLADMLHMVDTLKKKYGSEPIASKDDFKLLMNVYGLVIDQGYQIITNLYLPNTHCVLLAAKQLSLSTANGDTCVHPAVDRRICAIAGLTAATPAAAATVATPPQAATPAAAAGKQKQQSNKVPPPPPTTTSNNNAGQFT